MADIDGLLTEGTAKTVDPIATLGGVTKYKEAIAARAATNLDDEIASQRVGTGVDDGVFGVATDPIAVIGALADETATDSVSEGDIGALRMTLNRRLITAIMLLDDAAFGVATDYVAAIGMLADDTSPDSVTEGDIGAPRMTLARKAIGVSTADAAAITVVASQDTNITILAANANRIGATIHNTDTGPLYLKFGATAIVASSFTVKIPADGYYELPAPVYRGIIDGIWTSSGSGSAFVTELT